MESHAYPDAQAPERVVFVVAWYPSHLLGSMGLARRLQSRGYAVEFWADRYAEPLVRAQGFAFFELKSLWHSFESFLPTGPVGTSFHIGMLRSALRARRNRRRALPGALALFERSLQKGMARGVPRLAIFDPFLAAYHPFFKARGVRCIVLCDKPLPQYDPIVPPPVSRVVPGSHAVGRVRVAAAWARLRLHSLVQLACVRLLSLIGGYSPLQLVEAIGRRTGMRSDLQRVRRRVGYDLQFPGLEEWVLGAPETDFPRARALPAHIRYIGPCVDLARVEVLAPVGGRPADSLVYVSVGTAMPTWNSDVRLLTRILIALRDVPHLRIIVSTGNPRAREALAACAANVEVYESVPQLGVLRQADLAITHGGANTFRECIATQTPLLVFPRSYDQPGNAARAVYLGIGLMGSRRFDSSSAIRGKVLRILHRESFRQRLRDLHDRVESCENRLLERAIGHAIG